MQDVIPTQPYIPSFLSMRELEHVLAIYDRAIASLNPEDRPDVVFVDGFGRWHERQAGLATALGVERGIITIGIGKEYQPLRPDLGMFDPVIERLPLTSSRCRPCGYGIGAYALAGYGAFPVQAEIVQRGLSDKAPEKRGLPRYPTAPGRTACRSGKLGL